MNDKDKAELEMLDEVLSTLPGGVIKNRLYNYRDRLTNDARLEDRVTKVESDMLQTLKALSDAVGHLEFFVDQVLTVQHELALRGIETRP
ncbi:hypothetical protein BJD55_gp047 [Gordonia phage Yvonnetastic]|uniref:Uncharacterized protein n=1 Tax=Gordonia phage Yvonnetastic TaxID=1821566 RepID=A0A142K9D6_9CAUD|nr:hypothetical protein BJD55_gp047 [Gordonia phage Yvonnetastic]AMS02719.1 hypothetical protein SEA_YVONNETASTIC_175 [Gordonia phage Yvonnetastic]